MDVRKIAAVDLLRLATLAAGSTGENGAEVFDIIGRCEDIPAADPAPEAEAPADGAGKLAKPEEV